MGWLREMLQETIYRLAGACLKGSKRAGLIVFLIAVMVFMNPLSWPGGGVAYCDDTTGGDTGDSGDSGGDAGDDGGDGDAGDDGGDGDAGGDEGDAGGDDAAGDDGADDAGEDDGADDEAADDEAADDDEADDEPEGDEDDGADEDNEGDNEDEIEDDADSDDDTESADETSDSPLASMRRFSIDGLKRSLYTVPDPAAVAEWKRNHGSVKRLGVIGVFTSLQDQEEQLLSNWRRVPVPQRGAADLTESEVASNLKLPQAGLPRYRAGDTYVYSDGTWERVVASDGYGVRWVNHRGNASSGSLDFTYKRVNWQTSTRKGSREFQQTSYLFSKSTTTLWPLAVGNETRFDEFGRWSTGDGVIRSYDSFWRCEVEGTERIKAAAGEFDSWRITCARYSNSFSYPRSKAREYKTWNYVPVIGHWVVENRDNRGYRPNKRKELVAVMPDLLLLTGDDSAVAQLQEQFQDVLENYKSGQSDMWMEKSGAITSTIIPKATYVREDGVYCRQYTHYIQTIDYSGTYGGMACRGADTMWRVFRR